jgi:hypothetical protein
VVPGRPCKLAVSPGMSKPRRDTEATYVIDRDGWPEYPEHYVKIGHTRIRIPLRSEGFNGSHDHVAKLFSAPAR